MTKTRKKTLAVLMALSVVIPGSIAPTSEAAAKKVKLSKTKVSIQVGKTKKITIKNANTLQRLAPLLANTHLRWIFSKSLLNKIETFYVLFLIN